MTEDNGQTFRLGPPFGRRFLYALVGAFVILLGLGCAALLVHALLELVVRPKRSAEDNPLAIAAILAAISLPMVWFLYAGYSIMREYSFRGAKLTIGQDDLTIEDPKGLKTPVTVPLTDVVACSVDYLYFSEVTPTFPITRTKVWPGSFLHGASNDLHGFVIQPGHALAPILPVGSYAATVCLVFARPVQFEINTTGEGIGRRIRLNAETGSLILPVIDANQLAAALALRGVRGHIETADVRLMGVHSVEPRPGRWGRKSTVQYGWEMRDGTFLTPMVHSDC